MEECPWYEVFVDTNGGVVYWGERGVARLGVHYGHVDPARVRALLRAATDDGYFESERVYSSGMTDVLADFSSVVAGGRHHHVINEDDAAPDVVRQLEDGIDALLAETVWMSGPGEAVDSTACASLGEAVTNRCLPQLELASTMEDCEHWFLAWNGIRASREEASVQAARCARTQASLERLEPAPSGVSPPDVALGPRCRRAVANARDVCVASLGGLSNDAGACIGAGSLTRWILRATAAGGSEGTTPALERYCTTFEESR
jgi:hypothetical protein